MNYQLGAFQKRQQIIDNLGETRLILLIGTTDAVHGLGAFIDIAIGVQEAMEVATGQAAVDELEAADFDDAMAVPRGQARCFGVEDYLSHVSFALGRAPTLSWVAA